MVNDDDIRREYNTKNDGFYAVFMVILMVLSVVFVIGSAYLVSADMVRLHGRTNASDLVDYASKLHFTFRYTHPSAAFILFMVFNVITKRVFGQKYRLAALHPQAQNRTDNRIPMANSILQNSLEQFIINVFTQLALITYMSAEETLKVIIPDFASYRRATFEIS